MSFLEIIVLALGLSMDATAVAAARGAAAQTIRARDALFVGLLFGTAHVAMPLAGALAGEQVGAEIARWDHWVVFVLLVAIGGKMIWQANKSEEQKVGLAATLVLAIATALDALAVGITLPMLDAPLALSVGTIGGVAATATMLGLVAGRRFGARIGPRADIAGGLVLIALAIKILVEHLR
jgi:putative Mn2+ efflux pump MntP